MDLKQLQFGAGRDASAVLDLPSGRAASARQFRLALLKGDRLAMEPAVARLSGEAEVIVGCGGFVRHSAISPVRGTRSRSPFMLVDACRRACCLAYGAK